jgi:8-oxo-dGTP diphosphatase
MEEFKYCPMCASSLREEHIEGRNRLVCSECGWINYLNPLPVITCLVSNPQGDLLLIKRGVEPCQGCWALPGGFIERQETIQEAGRRELEEETGLKGEPGRLVGAHVHESPLYGSVVVLGMEFAITDGKITVGDDASDAKFFPRNELPEIPFKSHIALINEFLPA